MSLLRWKVCGDDVPAVPWVKAASEGDSHDSRGEGADDDKGADPVDLRCTGLIACALARIMRWKEEGPDWCEDGTDYETGGRC